MRFEWDERKNAANGLKHGVPFEIAIEVWNDPRMLVVFDREVDGEDRWHAIGLIDGLTVVLVVHAFPDPDADVIRVIGA